MRALSSITFRQAETIAQAVQASSQAWDVQTMDDYDGYLSILIEPSVSDEHPAFVISGTTQHFKLFSLRDDDMGLVADFNDVEDLLPRLLRLINDAADGPELNGLKGTFDVV